jgi:hypothetical protein
LRKCRFDTNCSAFVVIPRGAAVEARHILSYCGPRSNFRTEE